jgi:DNA replication protein DnaC
MADVCKRCDGMGMRVVVRPNGQRLAEECECRHTRKLTYAFGRCKIPPKYEGATLESYDTRFPGAHASLQMAQVIAKRFADDYPAPTPGRGLMFSGSSGLGKTHLAVGILKVMVLEKGYDGLFCYYQQLLKDIQNSWNPLTSTSELQVLEPVLNAEVLVLDDLGSVKPTDWVWDMVSMVLNTRYNQKRMTIVTSNFENLPAGAQKDQTLGDRIGDRMRSRLLEMCREVKMQGADYRESLGREEVFSPKLRTAGGAAKNRN